MIFWIFILLFSLLIFNFHCKLIQETVIKVNYTTFEILKLNKNPEQNYAIRYVSTC